MGRRSLNASMRRKIQLWGDQWRTSKARESAEKTAEEIFGAKAKPPWHEFAQKTLIRSGRKMIPFTAFEWQKEFAKTIENHYGTIVAKTRQCGATEFVASYFLWSAFRDPGYLAVIFSKTQDDTINIAKRVRLMASSHPDIVLETENTKDLKLKDGGRLLFKPSTPSSARGLESVCAILYDECAFVAGVEEIYGASLPSTEMLGDDPKNGAKIIILSTPNGRQGFYWQRLAEQNPPDRDILEVCDRVKRGVIDPVQHWTDEGGWAKFVVHWKAHPIYSKRPNYLEEIKRRRKMTEVQLQREYNLGFDESVVGRVFLYFKRDRHVLGATETGLMNYDPSLPLHLSFDFNYNPATCLIAQYNPQMEEVKVIHEFYLPDSNTFECSRVVVDWLKQHQVDPFYPLWVHGDASGNQRSANSTQTNWQIVWNTLRGAGFTGNAMYGRSNPDVHDSVNSCNYGFEEDLIFVNGMTCPELINDLEALVWKGSQIDKTDPARSHLGDCFRYLIHDLMPYDSKGIAENWEDVSRPQGVVA